MSNLISITARSVVVIPQHRENRTMKDAVGPFPTRDAAETWISKVESFYIDKGMNCEFEFHIRPILSVNHASDIYEHGEANQLSKEHAHYERLFGDKS